MRKQASLVKSKWIFLGIFQNLNLLKDGNITLQRNADENIIEYLGIDEPEEDESGEKINSTSRVTWSKTEYKWKKGNVGGKQFFKIKDPVSKKILTAVTDKEFELQGKF